MHGRKVEAVTVRIQTMLTELFAVISGDYNDRVFQYSLPTQGIKQLSELVVEIGDRPVVSIDLFLKLGVGNLSPVIVVPIGTQQWTPLGVSSACAEFPIKRRRRKVGIVGIVIIEKDEERTILVLTEPAQELLIDFLSRLAIQVLVVFHEPAQTRTGRHRSKHGQARNKLADGNWIILVVYEPSIEPEFVTAVQRVGDEASRQIAVFRKLLCNSRIPSVERNLPVGRQFVIVTAREHRRMRRKRPGGGGQGAIEDHSLCRPAFEI